MVKEGKQNCRNANFSATEKQLLYSLVNKYKNIIENKKTDAVSNEAKKQEWEKLTNEFNASCPDNRRRAMESLKKFYNNRKKEIRKVVAEETKERYLTGGGTTKMIDCPQKDLILSLMNKKSEYGLHGINDSDTSNMEQSKNDQVTVVIDDIGGSSNFCETQNEIVYEWEDGEPPAKKSKECVAGPSSASDWSNVTPSTLTASVNSALKKANGKFAVSRRRPTTTVKTLTSSLLAEKYQLLVDRRLAVADLERKKLEEDLKWQKEKQELEREALKLDIDIKKAPLKKLLL